MEPNDLRLAIGVIVASLLLVAGIVAVGKLVDTPDQVEMSKLVGGARLTKGNSEAKITIVEFADLQCPACKSAQPILNKFMDDFKDQVYFVYRHFPLPQHSNAKEAAYAVEAARQQGKFWQAHDWLFQRQSTWEDVEVDGRYFFERLRGEVGLDKKRFLADYQSDGVRKAVTDDLSLGREVGVNSTPTFFINGKKYGGVLSYEELKKATGVSEVTPSARPTDKPTPKSSPTPPAAEKE